MDKAACARALILRHPKAFSTHCWYDDEGLYGTCTVFYGRYRLLLRHRFSGAVLIDQTVWEWDPAYQQCVNDWRTYAMGILRRVRRETAELPHERAADVEFAAMYPGVHEHLTTDWLEGAPRVTSTVTLSCESGRFRASLRDRDNGMVLFVSGDSITAVLERLEAALQGSECEWREDRFAGQQGAAKGKGKRS